MLEYVLAATMLWSDESGQIRSQRANGVFESQQDCLEELTSAIERIRTVHRAIATPTGTLCTPREKALPKQLSQEQTERRSNAIAAAKAMDAVYADTAARLKAEAIAAGDPAKAAEIESRLVSLQELNARDLERSIEYIEQNPRPASTRRATPRQQARDPKALAAVQAAAQAAAKAVADGAASAAGSTSSQGLATTKPPRLEETPPKPAASK